MPQYSLVKQKLLRYRRPIGNPDRKGDTFMIQAFVCIGSNMGDAQEHLAKARAALASIPGVAVRGKSSLYRTEPQGRKDQPWFLNQVVCLDCENSVSAEGLLDAMLEKELELGRTTEVWFTGRELIERGAAKDYSEYLNRRIPMPGMSLMMGPDGFYAPAPGGWKRFELKECETISYSELIQRLNSPQAEVSQGDHPGMKKRSANKKPATQAPKDQAADSKNAGAAER